jgi:hypothetical protein
MTCKYRAQKEAPDGADVLVRLVELNMTNQGRILALQVLRQLF